MLKLKLLDLPSRTAIALANFQAPIPVIRLKSRLIILSMLLIFEIISEIVKAPESVMRLPSSCKVSIVG